MVSKVPYTTAVLSGLLFSAACFGQPMRIATVALDNTSGTCRGVEVAEIGGTRYAFCSLFDNGRQVGVDISDPANPVSCGVPFNPPFGDQFQDALYFDGYLFTAHRSGGLNMIDVTTSPCSMTTVSSVGTHYHFTGLHGHEESGQKFVFESEHNSGGSSGGLRIYDTTSGSLSLTGSILGNDRDGRDVVVTSDGSYAYQLDGGARSSVDDVMKLNVYRVDDKTAPVFLGRYDLGNTLVRPSGNYDLVLSRDERFLFSANDLDGFRVIDIQDRENPRVVSTNAREGVRVEGVELYNDAGSIAILTYRLPSGRGLMAAVNVSMAPELSLLWKGVGDTSLIYDVTAKDGLIYVASQADDGLPIMEVWF